MSIKSKAALAATLVFAVAMPFAASAEQSAFQVTNVAASGLELSAGRILDHYGFDDVDPSTLSASTLVEIIDIEQDEDYAGTTKGGIQAALKRFRPEA